MRDKIKWLLHESDISAYQIAKDTGINRDALYKYKNGKSEIGNMTLENAEKLADYADQLRKEYIPNEKEAHRE